MTHDDSSCEQQDVGIHVLLAVAVDAVGPEVVGGCSSARCTAGQPSSAPTLPCCRLLLQAANRRRGQTPWILVAGHRPMYCVVARGTSCDWGWSRGEQGGLGYGKRRGFTEGLGQHRRLPWLQNFAAAVTTHWQHPALT